MSDNYYKIYVDNTISLVQTLTIKSEVSAQMVNEYISMVYGADKVDYDDKTTWKYYKNICGEYHFSDEMIYITSLDTLEKIPFTKESFLIHRATLLAYAFGTRYYLELVDNHPDKEQLILGVLYPADMQKAISSSDGTILSYNKTYVEPNEYSLIENIQKWIYNYKIRWDVKSFRVSDNLYPTSEHGVFYLQLVPLIINLRLEKCKTNEAHSFHIRNYLASHGRLDRYLEFMTKFQSLFFYRNINYIDRNNGKSYLFDWLMNNVLTHRNIPLSSFTMKHFDALMPSEIKPEVTFERKPLNYPLNPDQNFNFTLDSLFNKEHPLELGNPEYIADNKEIIRKQFEYSTSGVVQTKALESVLLDKTDAVVNTLEDTILNHWIYLADKQIFKTFTTVKNPISGATYSLDTRDAFIYAMYCYGRALGATISNVPRLYAFRVKRIPEPSVEEIYKVVDPKYVDISLAHELKSKQPSVPPFISNTVDFISFCQKVFDANEHLVKLTGLQENLYARAMVKNMGLQFYCDKLITLSDHDQSFTSWLNEKGLPDDDFSSEQYLNIYNQLLTGSTGYSQEAFSYLRNMQNAMISIMKQLTSYSIQYLTKINNFKIKVVQWGVIRVSNPKFKNFSNYFLPISNIDILKTKMSSKQKVVLSIKHLISTSTLPIKQTAKYRLEIKVKPRMQPIALVMKSVRYHVTYDLKAKVQGEPAQDYEKSAFIGFNNYLSLTDQQKNTIKDIYNSTP